jgi:hypothetical protein
MVPTEKPDGKRGSHAGLLSKMQHKELQARGNA